MLMAIVTCELTWLRYLLHELCVPHEQQTTLFCDNQTTMYIAKNPIYHERTKHMELDCHTVRERIQKREINTAFIKSQQQIDDIFTKSL